MTPDCTIHARTPAEVVAVAPFLFGFHPTDSVVAIGMNGTSVAFALRYDLPPPGDDDTSLTATTIAAQEAGTVVMIGYGPPMRVTPALLRLERGLEKLGVRIRDALRVTEGHWWSYYCASLTCCPAEGTPCRPKDSVVAARSTFDGAVALPNRRALVAQVAAVEGRGRLAMVAATERAQARLTDLTAEDLRAGRGGRSVRRAGRIAVREAEIRARAGRAPTDEEVAWLGVLLTAPAVAGYTIDRSTGDEWRIRLWTDVLRRVEAAYVPVPASLLGIAAWQAGRGALARVAVDRALKEDPVHDTAALLDKVLGYGISPYLVDGLAAASRPGRSQRRPVTAARWRTRSAPRRQSS
jgi:uncharacterized protein DUF4192